MRFLKRWKGRTLLFLAIMGPGIITANVDNDAGGILPIRWPARSSDFSCGGLIPITLALIVVQEMCARMGAVTGKGLSDLIREDYGLRVTFWMMLAMLVCNFGNVVQNLSVSLPAWNSSGCRAMTVPICGVLVWLIVVKGAPRWKKFSWWPRFLYRLPFQRSAGAPGGNATAARSCP